MATYQLNFLQLCQKLRQEAGISGSGPLTTVNQTGELYRVVDWVQQSYNDIQEKHDDWNFLRFTFNLPLTIGQSVYSSYINSSNPSYAVAYGLPTNLADVANWRKESMRCYLYGLLTYSSNSGIVAGMTITGATSGATAYVLADTGTAFKVLNTNGIFGVETINSGMSSAVVAGPVSVGYNDEQWINYIDWDLFRDTRLRNANRFAVGRPIEYSIMPDKSIVVWPTPSDNYSIDGEFFIVPQAFVNDTDYPIFPHNHMVIVYNALLRYAGWVEGSAKYITASNEYKRLINKLEKDRLPPIMSGGSMV